MKAALRKWTKVEHFKNTEFGPMSTGHTITIEEITELKPAPSEDDGPRYDHMSTRTEPEVVNENLESRIAYLERMVEWLRVRDNRDKARY